MDPITDPTPSEALATVDAAIDAAREDAQEQAAEVIEAVVEGAAAQVDAANEAAEQILMAAMNTELGRRIAALEERTAEWPTMQSLLTTLQAEIDRLNLTVSSLSTPPKLEEPDPQPVPVEVVAVEPETLQNAEEENPAPVEAPAKPRQIWI